ncbi:DUF1707 SHOCT-like domain-containing protein [Nocardioides xinjiangensis]|uniref:DUF1707 SHOCT-like domain-containing protein n=1 Tax=Nocardioides xinjiangensis TaxID=2817376 RepID=UPI001B3103E7|nr:DUF1707 domain-containing protein [Nocardioides sp. SYSU D00778]
MSGFRARDADRDRYVEVIETAFVDGQLGSEDRDLRVARALTAETLAELDALTRDLQNRPDPLLVRPARAPAAARPRPPASGDSGAGKLIGVAVSVVAGLVFVGAVSSMHDAQREWGTDPAVEWGTDHAGVPWQQVEAVEHAPGFSMTPRHLRELVAAYEEQFGTREAYAVAFFPRRVTVQVPVAGDRALSERWTWDGVWSQDADAVEADPARLRVDVGAVDAHRLVDNIAIARRALGVERGRFTHALLTRRGAEPAEIAIHVGNELDESGHLSTTPAGEILRRRPYDR